MREDCVLSELARREVLHCVSVMVSENAERLQESDPGLFESVPDYEQALENEDIRIGNFGDKYFAYKQKGFAKYSEDEIRNHGEPPFLKIKAWCFVTDDIQKLDEPPTSMIFGPRIESPEVPE